MFLEEASTARYQILPKKSKLGYVIGKNGKICERMKISDSERKAMSESVVNEREIFTHWDSLSRQVSNKTIFI
jgi:hypothetical protein